MSEAADLAGYADALTQAHLHRDEDNYLKLPDTAVAELWRHAVESNAETATTTLIGYWLRDKQLGSWRITLHRGAYRASALTCDEPVTLEQAARARAFWRKRMAEGQIATAITIRAGCLVGLALRRGGRLSWRMKIAGVAWRLTVRRLSWLERRWEAARSRWERLTREVRYGVPVDEILDMPGLNEIKISFPGPARIAP